MCRGGVAVVTFCHIEISLNKNYYQCYSICVNLLILTSRLVILTILIVSKASNISSKSCFNKGLLWGFEDTYFIVTLL